MCLKSTFTKFCEIDVHNLKMTINIAFDHLWCLLVETCLNQIVKKNPESCLNRILDKLKSCLNQTLNKLKSCLNQTLNKPESCLNQTLNKPESCLNRTLNKLESCLSWTWNKVPMLKVVVNLTCRNWSPLLYSNQLRWWICKKHLTTSVV